MRLSNSRVHPDIVPERERPHTVFFNPERVQLPGDVRRVYGTTLIELREISDLARAASRAWSGVLVLSKETRLISDRLVHLGFAYPDLPLILVTKPDPILLARTAPLRIRRVVWLPNFAGLIDALYEIRVGRELEAGACSAEHSPALPVHLRRVVVAGLRCARPFRSVMAMVRTAGCSYDQLRREWLQVQGIGDRGNTLQTFVDWLVLLRAIHLKQAGHSWRFVEQENGIPYERLRRMAKRTCRTSLTSLCQTGTAAQFAAFRRELLDPLLATDPPADPSSREPPNNG
jgi:hypothetical protein